MNNSLSPDLVACRLKTCQAAYPFPATLIPAPNSAERTSFGAITYKTKTTTMTVPNCAVKILLSVKLSSPASVCKLSRRRQKFGQHQHRPIPSLPRTLTKAAQYRIGSENGQYKAFSASCIIDGAISASFFAVAEACVSMSAKNHQARQHCIAPLNHSMFLLALATNALP